MSTKSLENIPLRYFHWCFELCLSKYESPSRSGEKMSPLASTFQGQSKPMIWKWRFNITLEPETTMNTSRCRSLVNVYPRTRLDISRAIVAMDGCCGMLSSVLLRQLDNSEKAQYDQTIQLCWHLTLVSSSMRFSLSGLYIYAPEGRRWMY